jgi:hypothetical protein
LVCAWCEWLEDSRCVLLSSQLLPESLMTV